MFTLEHENKQDIFLFSANRKLHFVLLRYNLATQVKGSKMVFLLESPKSN